MVAVQSFWFKQAIESFLFAKFNFFLFEIQAFNSLQFIII